MNCPFCNSPLVRKNRRFWVECDICDIKPTIQWEGSNKLIAVTYYLKQNHRYYDIEFDISNNTIYLIEAAVPIGSQINSLAEESTKELLEISYVPVLSDISPDKAYKWLNKLLKLIPFK